MDAGKSWDLIEQFCLLVGHIPVVGSLLKGLGIFQPLGRWSKISV